MGNVAGALAGKHVLLTGVTGFVGEALLRLMLAEVPDVRLTLLIRPQGSTSGADRARTLLGKDIFTALGQDIDALLAGRIDVLEGDLSDVPALPTDLDAVVHCAGDVSFDPPVDEGFRTNVVGTRDLLERVREAGDDIHYVHISTAYVAGRRRGTIPEDRVDHAVDVDAELAWGLAQRTIVEHQSRSTAVLAKLRSRSERQHGRAGLLTAAAAAEERRKEWVKEHWSGSAPSAPAASAGPTATPSPRPSASGWSRRMPAPPASRSCGRASSSRPSRSPTPAGSRASRWPSR